MPQVESQDVISEPGNVAPFRAERPTRDLWPESMARSLALVVVLAIPSLFALHTTYVGDADVWWHLRTGEWILQHHAVPHTDPFSSYGAGRSWQAYSWLYELLLTALYRQWNLVGIVVYTATALLAISAAIYHMVRRLQPDFSKAMGVTFVAVMSLSILYTPRPWLLTILFFTLEMDVLMVARRSGRWRELLWLPPLFALWANVHVQFFDGLAVLGLFAVESLVSQSAAEPWTRIRPRWAFAALGASALAAMLNPYGWRIYQIGYQLASQPGVLNKISEMESIPFRVMTEFMLLFLLIAAAIALGWRRRATLFELGLLFFGAMLSFRSRRDVWITAVVSAAILANRLSGQESLRRRLPRAAVALVCIGLAGVLIGAGALFHVSTPNLRPRLAEKLPVRAVEFIKAHGYPGPLFNDYPWGGFLIWELRMPVSIDGRAGLHGDQRLDRSWATWAGEPGWASDPELAHARLVLGPVKSPLVQLLRLSPHWNLVYEDKLAAVFVARTASE